METYLSIAARPETVSFDPSRTAIMVIDMQNDFGSRGGMFDRAGLDVAPIARLIQPISRVLEAARAEDCSSSTQDRSTMLTSPGA